MALAAVWQPTSAALVERWYSQWWYPGVQRLVTPLSNLVPFAIFDVLVIGAVVWVVFATGRSIARARRTRRGAPLAELGLDILTAAAVRC